MKRKFIYFLRSSSVLDVLNCVTTSKKAYLEIIYGRKRQTGCLFSLNDRVCVFIREDVTKPRQMQCNERVSLKLRLHKPI